MSEVPEVYQTEYCVYDKVCVDIQGPLELLAPLFNMSEKGLWNIHLL